MFSLEIIVPFIKNNPLKVWYAFYSVTDDSLLYEHGVSFGSQSDLFWHSVKLKKEVLFSGNNIAHI